MAGRRREPLPLPTELEEENELDSILEISGGYSPRNENYIGGFSSPSGVNRSPVVQGSPKNHVCLGVNGRQAHNESHSQNQIQGHNGIPGHNGFPGHNGLQGQHGVQGHNELQEHNGIQTYNGIRSPTLNGNHRMTNGYNGHLQIVNEDENDDGSRPVSIYDNCERENEEIVERRRHHHTNGDARQAFINRGSKSTQPFCLNTTVPQNIAKDNNIAGKHAPTRNSLRHSRMIVMSRMGRVPKHSQPPIIRCHKIGKAVVGFQILFGLALCCLALWLFLWAPNMRTRDNPFWSALPLLLSGFFGTILLCCCRKEYPGMPLGFCVYSTKVVSVFLSTIAGAAGFIASIFAVIHLVSLFAMTCAPKDRLNETCVCTTGNSTTSLLPIKSYHYVDLSCLEVDNILTILLIFSATVNAMAGMISLWYVYLHWASRYMYVYSKVRTNELKPTVITNM